MTLLDLLFPMPCVGCGRGAVAACAGCRSELAAPARVRWPTPSPPGLPPPWAVTGYDGAGRAFLLGYKEHGLTVLRPVLAAALGASIAAATAHTGGRVVVVPVPSSRAAVRRRGDDAVLGLTRSAVRALGRRPAPTVVAALRHSRRVADSSGLGAEQRARNLAGAFAVTGRAHAVLPGARVVVTDDLVTTGASLAEAARALRAAGADVVAAATVAATSRHDRA